MLPLSLYIHIPWCIRKCPYCDFNSHQRPDDLPETRYVQALLADLEQDLPYVGGRSLESIFIGGGTPSLFSAQAFDTLFHGIQAFIPFAKSIEITLEANPGAVDQTRFNAYRAVGINRLSLGIQSFNSTHLKQLGRVHDGKQSHQAIEYARRAGFDNINLDLMHGLPQQSIADGLLDLQTAFSHQPEHLSWYQLTLEPNTVFYKKPPTLPTEDELDVLEQEGLAQLASHQFERYEISAFCRSKHFAQHNLNYWLFGDYLGIGAGAHGKLTSATTQQIIRTRKQKQPTDYLNPQKSFLVAQEPISRENLIFEFMLNTTRLQQAIPNTLFSKRTGLSFAQDLEPKLRQAEAKGLIQLDHLCWQVTALGRRFTNDLQAMFLIDL